jgi:hypothetical protein
MMFYAQNLEIYKFAFFVIFDWFMTHQGKQFDWLNYGDLALGIPTHLM